MRRYGSSRRAADEGGTREGAGGTLTEELLKQNNLDARAAAGVGELNAPKNATQLQKHVVRSSRS